jgi:hypothetical protein
VLFGLLPFPPARPPSGLRCLCSPGRRVPGRLLRCSGRQLVGNVHASERRGQCWPWPRWHNRLRPVDRSNAPVAAPTPSRLPHTAWDSMTRCAPARERGRSCVHCRLGVKELTRRAPPSTGCLVPCMPTTRAKLGRTDSLVLAHKRLQGSNSEKAQLDEWLAAPPTQPAPQPAGASLSPRRFFAPERCSLPLVCGPVCAPGPWELWPVVTPQLTTPGSTCADTAVST